MTEIELTGKTVFEFVIPTLMKDKQPVPADRVKSYKKAIKSRSIKLNGGFTEFPNCQGGYLSKSGEIVDEDVSIIKTHGQMPLSAEELEYFADYLYQECLYVEEAGESMAYLHEGGKSETTYSYHYKDGSFSEFSSAIDESGEQTVCQIDYDEDGIPNGGSYLSEDQVCQMISEGDAALASTLQQFSNP